MTNIWSFDKQRPTIGEIPLERDAEGAILKSLEKLSGKRTMVYWNSGDTLLIEGDPRGNSELQRRISQVKGQRRAILFLRMLFSVLLFLGKRISVVIRNKKKLSYIKINKYSESLQFISEEGDFT